MSPTRFDKDLKGSNVGHVKDIQVRPRVLQANLTNSPQFKSLPEGFHKVFTQQESSDENMRLPVVGYAGHSKGKKAENYFAKSFRDTAIYAESNVRKQRN